MKWHFKFKKKKEFANYLSIDESDRRYKKDTNGNTQLKDVNNSTLPPHIPQTDMAAKKLGIKMKY